MIAKSKKSASRLAISRRYEFSRVDGQTLASAYEALIPIVSQRAESHSRQREDTEVLAVVHRSAQRSAAGA